ncbi:MAG TPA: Gfo/Idh/MocA family oxidoreductase [Tepidisphaeraceae bacterium]|nr:Gfo/Idh/MocA family oxidoreductase [Tepidisphaeraceae bacterium]
MIGVAVIGSGQISLANHLPGFALCPDTKVVALCDSNPQVLEAAGKQTGITALYRDYQEAIARDDVNAVVIATPNFLHAPIALAAIPAGKHVLCEKPIAMNLAEALTMWHAAEKAGVRNMTAFTYRFVPAMRYMDHLVHIGAIGRPYHFRAQRFQDWGSRNLGWRQVKKLAGTGELGDMLSHRIDYGHLLIGPMRRLVADTRRFVDVRGGQPSDLDDWVAILCEYDREVTGVLESSKLAIGRGEGHYGQDVCEVNGSEGSIVFSTQRPLELRIGKPNAKDLETVVVPREFWVFPGSPRNPDVGDPVVTFRYDQDFEFIDAIRNKRPCRPSFLDGARAQAVIDATIRSAEEGGWVDVPEVS